MKQLTRVNGHRRNSQPHATARPSSNGAAAPPESPSPATALVGSLMEVVRDLFIVEDAASDLPLRQLRVCMVLTEGPQSMSALSRELGVSLSAMTQIADRLEAAGLAVRLSEAGDRRVRCLQLSPRGRQLMQRRQQTKTRRAQQALDRLSAGEQTQLIEALATLQTACRKDAPCLKEAPT